VKVLFDQRTPAPLRRALVGHSVEAAYERSWSTLQNGELIAAAETAQFEVLVTTDENLKSSRTWQLAHSRSSFSSPQVGRASRTRFPQSWPPSTVLSREAASRLQSSDG